MVGFVGRLLLKLKIMGVSGRIVVPSPAVIRSVILCWRWAERAIFRAVLQGTNLGRGEGSVQNGARHYGAGMGPAESSFTVSCVKIF